MDFNFFEWIRAGVKRSVLLGVSDAVEQMGMPQDEQTSQEKILSFLKEESPSTSKRRIASASGQRKLGRSISDIHPS